MRLCMALLVLALLPAVCGCASRSSAWLRGTDLDYPVSLTRSIVDGSGNAYVPTEGEKVKHFKRSWTRWQVLYGWLSINGNRNLGRLLNREIEKAGGNGAVNLKVRASGSRFSWFTCWLPILPERVKVVVEGDVIQTPAARL